MFMSAVLPGIASVWCRGRRHSCGRWRDPHGVRVRRRRRRLPCWRSLSGARRGWRRRRGLHGRGGGRHGPDRHGRVVCAARSRPLRRGAGRWCCGGPGLEPCDASGCLDCAEVRRIARTGFERPDNLRYSGQRVGLNGCGDSLPDASGDDPRRARAAECDIQTTRIRCLNMQGVLRTLRRRQRRVGVGCARQCERPRITVEQQPEEVPSRDSPAHRAHRKSRTEWRLPATLPRKWCMLQNDDAIGRSTSGCQTPRLFARTKSVESPTTAQANWADDRNLRDGHNGGKLCRAAIQCQCRCKKPHRPQNARQDQPSHSFVSERGGFGYAHAS